MDTEVVQHSTCGIVYHYPMYGDRLLIGRSNSLHACTKHSFILFSASRWHRRAGWLTADPNKNLINYQ